MPATFDGHFAGDTQPAQFQRARSFPSRLTVHGSGANRSARPRRAIALHYMTQETTYEACRQSRDEAVCHGEDGQKLQGEHFPMVWSR